MAGTAMRMRASAILLVVVSVAGHVAYADAQDRRPLTQRIERDIRRFKAVATDSVMELLAIKPGMTILDIGAGTGQFAYEFARRMGGTGKVYATDTNDSCIEYMKKEAERTGLGNLHPVLVGKDGVEPFYRTRKFDLVTVFHVSMTYEDQVPFFRELRDSLTEGGRLVLILYKIPAPFSRDDFTGDFRGFLREVSLEPPESPYYGIMKDSTRKRIRDNPVQDPPEELRNAIVEDFNETLGDNQFAAHFFDGSVYRKEARFFTEERHYADWFLPSRPDGGVRKPDSRVRSGDIRSQSTPGSRVYSTINKLLILQKYRKYLKKDGLFLSGFSPSIREVFVMAGYRLEREYTDVVPFEDIIVFSAP